MKICVVVKASVCKNLQFGKQFRHSAPIRSALIVHTQTRQLGPALLQEINTEIGFLEWWTLFFG